jgi:hypothetical protein
MNKNNQISLILLIVFTVFSVGFNSYQYRNINKSTYQINLLEHGENQLSTQITTLTPEKDQSLNQSSELNSKIANLEEKIKNYLIAEGKITVDGKKCEEEFEFCLDKLTENLTKTSGIDCSSIKDGSCPLWCAAGADADCCEQKPGYIWIQGRGCYDVNQI